MEAVFHILIKMVQSVLLHQKFSDSSLSVLSKHQFLLLDFDIQREFEKQAALMGGGSFVVPAQTVTDFLNNKLSGKTSFQSCNAFLIKIVNNFQLFDFSVTSLPPSSYRLGVKAANLHNLYPAPLTQALQHSISMFDKEVCHCFLIESSFFFNTFTL